MARRSLQKRGRVVAGPRVARLHSLQTAGSKRLRQRAARAARAARALVVRLVARGVARRYGALLLARWRRLGVVARGVVVRGGVARGVVVRGVVARGVVVRRGAVGGRLAGALPQGTRHRK